MTAFYEMEINRCLEFRKKDCKGKYKRPSNIEALCAYQVGEVNEPPCTHCERGIGIYQQCVSVKDFLNGSCANCHYNSEGTRCSLRKFTTPFQTLLIATDSNSPVGGRPTLATVTSAGHTAAHAAAPVPAASAPTASVPATSGSTTAGAGVPGQPKKKRRIPPTNISGKFTIQF